ncbi:alpha/beta fold hydrolase [Pseudomonas sp. 10S4]|uniref:alpha/beta fold hydrolase n=1 Tax=Pseudomonas sp. 10S4 TaxID=3048583 RepID=UPI003A103442
MFAGFLKDQRHVNGVDIAYRIGGTGPGLLLLHGHPQTHVIWHKIAEQLAEHFTVVAADLRGYGDSAKPLANDQHTHYSKREMAKDGVALMQSLGFERFSVLAHDRGARVAHRLALDHPDADATHGPARYRPDPVDVRANQRSVRPRLLALVLPDPPGTVAGNPDRGRSRSVPAQCDGQPQRRAQAVHRRGVWRIPALPETARHRARDLRGLPRQCQH